MQCDTSEALYDSFPDKQIFLSQGKELYSEDDGANLQSADVSWRVTDSRESERAGGAQDEVRTVQGVGSEDHQGSTESAAHLKYECESRRRVHASDNHLSKMICSPCHTLLLDICCIAAERQ